MENTSLTYLARLSQDAVERHKANQTTVRELTACNHSCKTCAHFTSGLHTSHCLFKHKAVKSYNICHLHLSSQKAENSSEDLL